MGDPDRPSARMEAVRLATISGWEKDRPRAGTWPGPA